MTSILGNLEPRRELSGTIVINELDEMSEILFFLKGQIDIGFQFNRKKYFTVRKNDNIQIGALGCTYNYESEFIYRAFSTCEGYSLRKEKWNDVLDNFPEIAL